IGEDGGCAVRIVAILEGGRRWVDVALERPRAVTPSIAQAIRAMGGVVEVTLDDAAQPAAKPRCAA
ncbi:MAG: hypothetical protein AAGF45_10000, partial [Pseudomonadota bacterium]